MVKKSRSSHLSIKRLRDLAHVFEREGDEDVLFNFMLITRFINFVEKSRASLAGHPLANKAKSLKRGGK